MAVITRHRLPLNSYPCVILTVIDKAKKTKKTDELEPEKCEKEADENLERKKKQFPGLCIPNDHDRVQKLIEHQEEDVKVAREAMSEVRKRW